MANREGRRRFGNVRRRESGRYQASYIGPDGRRHFAPRLFERKQDADRWLALVESQIIRREWTDPERAKLKLGDYVERWIAERPGLRPRTIDLYTWLYRRYIKDQIGSVPIGALDTPGVRTWRAKLLESGVSQSMAAKAYRLLRAALMTAVEDDKIIPRNPCRIRGAQDEQTPERPILTLAQVYALADAIAHKRYRVLVLVATFGSLRWGEVSALRRRDVNVAAGTVSVRQAYVERSTGELVVGPPKSKAGKRTVRLPEPVMSELSDHLDEYVGDDPDALVFAGESGVPLRRSNFNKVARWSAAVAKVGVKGLHFHDLRHTGNMLAAETPGVTLRDLMARMGHDSERAALIYQHASQNADQGIAAAMTAGLLAFEQERAAKQNERAAGDDEGQDDDDDGGSGALVPTG